MGIAASTAVALPLDGGAIATAAPKVVMARAYLPEAVDPEIRRRHSILLPRDAMG